MLFVSLTVLYWYVCGVVVSSTRSGVLYADNGWEQTVPFPLYKSRERQEFQRQILQLLGLTKAPRPKRPADATASRFMVDLYRSYLTDEEGNVDDGANDGEDISPVYKYLDSSNTHRTSDESPSGHRLLEATELRDFKAADTIMSFVQREHESPSVENYEHLSFDISDVPEEHTLIAAELRYLSNVSDKDGIVRVNVYVIIMDGIDNPMDDNAYGEDMLLNTTTHLKLVASSNGTTSVHNGWRVLNITDAFYYWRRRPNRNAGLLMEVLDETGSRRRLSSVSRPFMVGFFNAANEHAHTRVKRSSNNQGPSTPNPSGSEPWYTLAGDETMARRSCQKRTLYVSFRDLGWQTWVIAPEGYAAYYCDGVCFFPLNAHMNATNHAIVQTLVHLMDPYRAPKPKCAPTKLSSMKVLYYDDTGNVVLKRYNNMVVRSCGCQ